MDARSTSLLDLLSEHIAATNTKCYWHHNKNKEYLAIPCSDDFNCNILKSFLIQNNINPLTSSKIPNTLMLSVEDAKKLAAIIRKDESLFADVRIIITGLDKIIHKSTFGCEFTTTPNYFLYEFTHHAGSRLLRSVIPNQNLLKVKGKRCELMISQFNTLAIFERCDIMQKMRTLLEKLVASIEVATGFIKILPKDGFAAEPSIREGDLNLHFLHEYAAALRPVFLAMDAIILNDGHFKIPLEKLNVNDLLNLTKDTLTTCTIRMSKLSLFQHCLLITSEFEVLYQDDCFSIQYLTREATPHLISACEESNVIYIQKNHTITFDYEDIFNLDDQNIASLKEALEEAKATLLTRQFNKDNPPSLAELQTLEISVVDAIKQNNVERLHRIITMHGLNINEPLMTAHYEGSTMVMLAASQGANKVLTWLIDNMKADFTKPMTKGPHAGLTPLFAAAQMGDTTTISTLIEAGADYDAPIQALDSKSKNVTPADMHPFAGRRPIFAAAARGRTDAVHCLIEHGADFLTPLQSGQSQGASLIGIAIANSRPNIVTLLMHHNADHTALISGCPSVEVAKTLTTSKKYDEDAKKVLQLLTDENRCMEIMLNHFMQNPLLEDEHEYKWITTNGEIKFIIPCKTELMPYLINFLEAQGIATTEVGNKAVAITKSGAKQLVAIISNDKHIWIHFLNIMRKIYQCIKLSSYQCNMRLTNLFFILELNSEPGNYGFSRLLSQSFVEKLTPTAYKISLAGLIKMSMRQRVELLLSFDIFLKESKDLYSEIKHFLECAVSQTTQLEASEITAGRLEIFLNHRSAALAMPVLNALEDKQIDHHHSLSLDCFRKLSGTQREGILNEVKARQRKLDAMVALTLRFGKRKISYHENEMVIKFSDTNHESHFLKAFAHAGICTTTHSSYESFFEMPATHFDKINTLLDLEAARKTSEASYRKRLIQSLNQIVTDEAAWKETNSSLRAEVTPRCAALLSRLKVPSLSIISDPTLSACIDLQQLYDCDESEFARIAQNSTNILEKLDVILKLMRVINQNERKSNFTLDGIIIRLDKIKFTECFIKTCHRLLKTDPEDNNIRLICYDLFLQLNTDELKKLLVELEHALITAEQRALASRQEIKVAPVIMAVSVAALPPKHIIAPPPKNRSGHTANNKGAAKNNNAKRNPQTTAGAKQTKRGKNPKPGTRIPEQPARNNLAIPTSGGGSYSNGELVKKSLGANKDQSTGASPQARNHVQYVDRFFVPARKINYAEMIRKALADLAIQVLLLDIYSEATDDSLTVVQHNLLNHLIELGRLSAFIPLTNEFNFFIREFLKDCLIKFPPQTPDATPPTMILIQESARRGQELWQAFVDAEETIAHSLLSSNK